MIISRPRTNALFALTVFIIIALSLAYAGIQGPLTSGKWNWYNYIAVYGFGPLAVVLAIRMLINFKLIYLGKGQIEVKYPFRLSARKYNLKELDYWTENRVKTGKTLFREMEIKFPRKKIKISMQENSSYKEIFQYFSKKASKKKQ